MNKESLVFFKNIADNKKINEKSVKLLKNNDFTDIDANFILEYTNENTRILDLGSGTGLIVNKIYYDVKHIVCVEPYKEFTKFIVKNKNVSICNKSIFDYNTDEKFDLITMFGLMHYFDETEAKNIYKKFRDYLANSGKIIIKNQFGIKTDVLVNGYSEELNRDYFAEYRHIDKEVKLLDEIGYKNIEVIDVYPPEANRWDNTHFYAIVADV